MLAGLGVLCVSVYWEAHDRVPATPRNGRRKLTDADIVTFCVAEVLTAIPNDRRFLWVARWQRCHLLPVLARHAGSGERRANIALTLRSLTASSQTEFPTRMTISEKTRRSEVADAPILEHTGYDVPLVLIG